MITEWQQVEKDLAALEGRELSQLSSVIEIPEEVKQKLQDVHNEVVAKEEKKKIKGR